MDKITKITVEIKREIFANEDSMFYIYSGILDGYEEISIKCNGFELSKGIKVLAGVMGTYNNMKSFQAKYEEFDENSRSCKYNLLCSISGIKDKTANQILDWLGDRTLDTIKDTKEKIKGLGTKKLDLVKEGLKILDSMKILKELNILIGSSAKQNVIKELAQKIECEDGSLDKFRSNPYDYLIAEFEMSFKRADKIALGMGIDPNCKMRQKYLLEYIVKCYTSTGNVYIEKNYFYELISEYNINRNSIDLDNNERLVVDGECVYTKKMYMAETEIPCQLKEIASKSTDEVDLDTYEIESYITEFEGLNRIKFHETQIEAINESINNKVFILTGEAGTGKTSVLKCIIYCLKRLNYSIKNVAPTGKAARRMEQATGTTSTTIHSFMYSEMYTTSKGCIIIDESSMVDLMLMYDLLSCMEESPINFKKVIIVGDDGQLPSVGTGSVLKDLIESKIIKHVHLTHTFRQANGGNILDVANSIRNNESFNFMKKADFYCREAKTKEEFLTYIFYFYENLKKRYTVAEKFYQECQLVIPMKKGEIGVTNINDLIKEKYNPLDNKRKELRYNNKWFFPFDKDDKVMCIKNDKTNMIMNGEAGIVTMVTDKHFTVYYYDLQQSVTYVKNIDECSNFMLAYVATVHKLQGSEFKFIVIIVSQDSMFLDSRLLYTAVTRGKQTVILISQQELINKICKRNHKEKRNSNLKMRLKKEFES
jgi:exodeoxyribonuclease V alpha subunit